MKDPIRKKVKAVFNSLRKGRMIAFVVYGAIQEALIKAHLDEQCTWSHGWCFVKVPRRVPLEYPIWIAYGTARDEVNIAMVGRRLERELQKAFGPHTILHWHKERQFEVRK